MLMAVSILGAYMRRLGTSLGEHLQVAMQDAILNSIRNAFTFMERTGGQAAPRAASRTVGGDNPPIGVYPCKGGGPDDYVYIYTSTANPEHWTRLLKVMVREDLIGDPRFAPPAARTEHRADVDRIVAEWTSQQDKHTAMPRVGSATTLGGAVLDTKERADDPTFLQRGIRQTLHHPAIGDYVMSGWPVRFGGRPSARKAAPLPGERGDQVLSEWLGYDAGRIANLKNNEVIG